MVGGFCGWAIADPPTGDQQEGNFYFNVVSGKWRWYHTGSWQDIPGGAAGAVTSVFTRTGAVVAQTGDYNPVEVGFSAYPIVNADIAANAGITSGKVVALVNLGTSVFSAYPLVPGVDVVHDSYSGLVNAPSTSSPWPTGPTSIAWGIITSVPSLVNSFNSRTGVVAPATGDYTPVMVGFTGYPIHNADIADLAYTKLTSVPSTFPSTPHNLLDGSVDQDTAAHAAVRGGLIIGNSTPVWAYVALGASATYLRSNGTDAGWSSIAWTDLTGVPSTFASTPHALLDGSVDNDTAAHAPVRGGLIVGNATPNWAYVALGASATYLRSNGTDAGWSSLLWADLTGVPATFASTPHALLDGSVDNDTAAHAPVRGGLIIGNATPAWAYVALGASGQYLRSNGTDAGWTTITTADLTGRIAQANQLLSTYESINASVVQASGKVTSATSIIKTYALAANTYTNIVTFIDGYILGNTSSVLQQVQIYIFYGASQAGNTMIFELANRAASSAPFALRVVAAQAAAANINVNIKAAGADNSTVIFVNSMFVDGLV